MSKCRQCGFELDADVRYCPNCATKVDTTPRAEKVADAFTGTISGTATMVAREPAVSSPDLEPGTEFHGRYKIERKLGQGAMGVVYLAGDKLTGRRVAMKLINPALMNSASARERFLREGLIARDIRHKNVVAVYDVGETEGQYYLVMEYLSGETLRDWLHNFLQSGTDVPYATAEKIIRNVLEGLGAAHASGVVHRDVKPENIMLTGKIQDEDYSLKLLDFGIARAIDNSPNQVVTTTTSTGTALYMAPEQKTAADTVGPPADLYAVSAIFYELLLGVAPTGRWTPLTQERGDLPSGIDAVIDKGLSSRPRSRYQSVQEYLRALHEIRTAPAPPPVPKPKPAPPPMPSPSPIIPVLPVAWWRKKKAIVIAISVFLGLWLIGTFWPDGKNADFQGQWYDELAGTGIAQLRIVIQQSGNSISGTALDAQGMEWGTLTGSVDGNVLNYNYSGRLGNGFGRGELDPDANHVRVLVNGVESHILHRNHLPPY